MFQRSPELLFDLIGDQPDKCLRKNSQNNVAQGITVWKNQGHCPITINKAFNDN
ncbi:MAG: hypothetical protein V7K89_17900 [Nostoc sp.]|uniref:hypothetical protein n=1 Tax=Nostoc sp. TaxID=1180 RepID=UPI002FFB3631